MEAWALRETTNREGERVAGYATAFVIRTLQGGIGYLGDENQSILEKYPSWP